jgi:hypothetical protein
MNLSTQIENELPIMSTFRGRFSRESAAPETSPFSETPFPEAKSPEIAVIATANRNTLATTVLFFMFPAFFHNV